jgi:hypothetical protein
MRHVGCCEDPGFRTGSDLLLGVAEGVLFGAGLLMAGLLMAGLLMAGLLMALGVDEGVAAALGVDAGRAGALSEDETEELLSLCFFFAERPRPRFSCAARSSAAIALDSLVLISDPLDLHTNKRNQKISVRASARTILRFDQ